MKCCSTHGFLYFTLFRSELAQQPHCDISRSSVINILFKAFVKVIKMEIVTLVTR